MVFEINSDANFVDAENPVDSEATGFTDGSQIDSGALKITQPVVPESEASALRERWLRRCRSTR
jgi:hypothetical protein